MVDGRVVGKELKTRFVYVGCKYRVCCPRRLGSDKANMEQRERHRCGDLSSFQAYI